MSVPIQPLPYLGEWAGGGGRRVLEAQAEATGNLHYTEKQLYPLQEQRGASPSEANIVGRRVVTRLAISTPRSSGVVRRRFVTRPSSRTCIRVLLAANSGPPVNVSSSTAWSGVTRSWRTVPRYFRRSSVSQLRLTATAFRMATARFPALPLPRRHALSKLRAPIIPAADLPFAEAMAAEVGSLKILRVVSSAAVALWTSR